MRENIEDRYNSAAQFFHWLIAILVLTQFILAAIFSDMPLGLEKIAIIVQHKAVGMTIFMLAVLRVSWRFINPPPPLLPTQRAFERVLAKLAHYLLYGFIIAIPVSGWLMSSAANIPVDYFTLFKFPLLIEPDKQVVKLMKSIHYGLNIGLACLLFLHIAATIRHHFILRDATLTRMLPRSLGRLMKNEKT